MTEEHREPVGASAARQLEEPLLVEDLLLLLFQPDSGAIAGETTLFYVLGGAVVAELALRNLTEATGRPTHRVSARGEAPEDPVLRAAWDYLRTRALDPQSAIAAIGPPLRGQVLDRLVGSGHLRRHKKKRLGFIPSTSFTLGSARRSELLAGVRATLVDAAEPDARTAALAALLSASANLHQFDPEIPWTSAVIHRAKDLENGSWGAAAAGTSVTMTTLSILLGALGATSGANTAGR
ncbi:GPP34 family phosphoprotein [Ruania sp. N2-46]|uniref:GPP34 family phosphoprotein n=2 Tax=Occultella gossypii TaxID=2800820 RepID=A0ABS7S988_9MICO|nr:GPP34 family phosphoprotein [Occultella gossypii]